MRTTSMGATFGVVVLGLAGLSLLGCSDSHGRGGERCGIATCAAGAVCCNASCGICAAPDEGCPAIACVDAGGPLCGREVCGGLCCPGCPGSPDFCVSGGSCPDVDCPPPPPGCESCEPGQLCCPGCPGGGPFCMFATVCPDISCPPLPECDDDVACPAGLYCQRDEACSGPGLCQPTPDGCPRDCPGVCGCDGRDYCNACNAAQAGVGVSHEGACAEPSCEGRSYCACVDTPGCAPLVDLTPGCICPCDDPFNCTGETCACACGGAEYRGCADADRCAETELRCDPGCNAIRGPDGCLTCVCPDSP